MNLLTAGAIAGFAINLLALLGIYSKLSVMTYQHRLMWSDYMKRKNIEDRDHQV